MTERVAAKSPFVDRWGFSRGVAFDVGHGKLIEVAGTTALSPDGEIDGGDNPYLQTKAALQTIAATLGELGASLADVVRTRVYLVDIANWEGVGRAHLEAFGETLPASSAIGGARFLRPGLVVEIEATAYVER
jgi:enamine deaminase RidA (YjgF/YER057c/UK114 family)